MISVGVRDLKNNLSRYLSHVKDGEVILITKRGKPIARLMKELPDRQALRTALNSLASKQLITLPTRGIDKDIPDPIVVEGKPVSEMIIEDRR